MSETKFTVRLFIDSKTKKVLFAEARRDFVDFLYGLLYLPIGTVSRLLKQEGKSESVESLCKSIENSDKEHFVLNPVNMLNSPDGPPTGVYVPLLFPNKPASNLYMCSSNYCKTCVTNVYGGRCPCTNSMLTFNKAFNSERGYVKNQGSYIVGDDLSVKPVSVTSILSWLRSNDKDLNAIEERDVDIGRREGIKLLKAALESKELLTNVFIEENKKGALEKDNGLENNLEIGLGSL